MNQTQNITVPHSKTYDITMTALMAAVTCILAPLSIPIGPVFHSDPRQPCSAFSDNLYFVSFRLHSGHQKCIHQLCDLSAFGSGGTSGIFRIHWRSCEAGRSYRWIYHWIYRHGSHCRTGYR